MNFLMPKQMKPQYFIELEEYQKFLRSGNLQVAWRYLERAHIIGQYHPISHFAIHFRMLIFAIRVRDRSAFLDQILGLRVESFGSIFNRISFGNKVEANGNL